MLLGFFSNKILGISSFILLATVTIQHVDAACSYVPILSGITPLQSFGESNKRLIPQTTDCKAACAAEKGFVCTGFLWPIEGGDCYLFDKMNLSLDIFRNTQNSYVMYVQVCDGQATPSVGYCQFLQNKTSVVALVTPTTSISPGIAAESSCREFCIARYQGVDCNAYVVSNDTKQLSQCVLYSQVPSGLGAGTSNLYVKNCKPPPVGCQYTTWGAWGACTTACTMTRSRGVVAQATEGGAPCLNSEMVGESSCTASPCVVTVPTTTAATTRAVTGATTGGAGSGTGATTPSSGSGTGGSTTRSGTGTGSSPPPQQDGSCRFTDWTSWSSCSSLCLQVSTRTLTNGTAANCIEADGSTVNMSKVCTGGACTGGSGGTPTTTPKPVAETGCRFNDIDPQSRPSTLGFKAVGAQASCAARCAAETSFKCEAYVTTGPGGPCVLHGAVDSPTNVVIMSSWYLQDLNCKVNKTAATSLCGWQMVRADINALQTNAQQWKSLGYAINADHCGTLCMMNHPMYKPNPCGAYAYTYDLPWAGPKDNCYEFTPIDNPWAFNSTGTFDLYKQVCYANATSVASSKQG